MENQFQNSAQHNPQLSFSSIVNDFFQTLTYSEWHLIVFMGWQPLDGQQPPADLNKHGDIEFGDILFLLNNPDYINNSDIKLIVEVLLPLLKYEGLPSSNISSSNYNTLQYSHSIYKDGSVVATSPFALYDQNWLIALCNFILTLKDNAFYNNYNLPLPSYSKPIPMQAWSTSNNRFTLALLADWGAGTGEAMGTLNYALLQVPDCIIHLGDVYYSGSPVSNSSLPDYVHSGEEINNFLKLWPTGWDNRSFTLNSNHEMYCGGNGLFNDVLVPSSPFKLQGPNSIFAISIGDWTVLGLDSAYYSNPGELFMYGNLVPNPTSTPDQITWVQSLKLNPAKTILLTHHNGFDFNCDPEKQSELYTPFWNQINEALGAEPYAWYWGHIHNGIVYTKPVTIGTAWTTNTYCRCLGNASMPYGTSTDLVNQPSDNIEWFAGMGEPIQELTNGYVILSFELDAEIVTSISERFYLGPEQVFSKTIF